MSTNYIAILVLFLLPLLQKLGVTVGNDELTTAITVIVSLCSGLYLAYKRHQLGGITWYGART